MSDDRKLQIKSLEEMIQGVLLAIPREISARQFYMGLAGKAISDDSRNLFVTLAEQEKGHEAELRRIIGELKRDLEDLKK